MIRRICSNNFDSPLHQPLMTAFFGAVIFFVQYDWPDSVTLTALIWTELTDIILTCLITMT